jgi:signal transduction histidine kinase
MLQEEDEDLKIESLVPDLKKIRTAGRHLLALINDVLDVTKIEAGRMQLYPETFDVGSLIREITDTVKPSMDANNNTLVWTQATISAACTPISRKCDKVFSTCFRMRPGLPLQER